MPKMLADATTKLVALPGHPLTNLAAPTVAQVTAVGAIDLSCLVTKANYQFGAAADDKVAEAALCDEGNAQSPGNSNYVATMTFFRFADTADDDAWTAFADKNLDFTLVERRGKAWSLPFVATDVVKVMEVVTTTPQDAGIEGAFHKFVLEFLPQQVESRAVVAA